MGRLTKWNENKKLLVREEERLLNANGIITKDEMYKIMRHLAEKLVQYEDLEEQGLLKVLPCKVGDTLYYPSGYFNIVIPIRLNEIVMSFVGLNTYSFQYNCCSFDECGDVYEEYEFDLDDFGKTVFLTQAEAEQKLKEIELNKDLTAVQEYGNV